MYIYRKRGRICPLFSRRSHEQKNGRQIGTVNVNITPENGQPFWDGHIYPQYLADPAPNNRRTSSQLTLRSRLSLNLEPLEPIQLQTLVPERYSSRTDSTDPEYIVPSDYVLGRGSQATTINIMLDEPERAITPGPGIFRFPFGEQGAPGSPQNTTSVIEQVRVFEDIIEEVYTVEEVTADGAIVEETINQLHIVEEIVDHVLVTEDDNSPFVVGDDSDREEEVEVAQRGSYVVFHYQ